MDTNKRLKLIDIGYSIAPSCGTCKYFNSYIDPEFGDCSLHKYVHLKHSGGERRLGVVQYGYCNKYEATDLDFLHGYKEFLSPGSGVR